MKLIRYICAREVAARVIHFYNLTHDPNTPFYSFYYRARGMYKARQAVCQWLTQGRLHASLCKHPAPRKPLIKFDLKDIYLPTTPMPDSYSVLAMFSEPLFHPHLKRKPTPLKIPEVLPSDPYFPHPCPFETGGQFVEYTIERAQPTPTQSAPSPEKEKTDREIWKEQMARHKLNNPKPPKPQVEETPLEQHLREIAEQETKSLAFPES